MHFFTSSDGARIAYRDTGTGPALLCLAGLSRNSTDFDYVWPHLDGVRAIAMDYRGRGQSEWTGADTYTIPREAQDVLELLDHLDLERTAILGTSRGGLIAMALAATAKDRLSGVMLNDIGPALETGGLEGIRDYIGRNPAEKTMDAACAMRAALNPGFVDVPSSRWAEEVERHYVQKPGGLEINYDPELGTAVRVAMDGPSVDLWPFFEELSALPAAALRGANSNLLSAQTFLEMQNRLPDLIAAEVADRGHVPFLDEPESLFVLDKFLKEIR